MCNMANSSNSQEQLVVHGSLPALLNLIDNNDDIITQQQALLTINNLSANDMNHATMIHKNILPILSQIFNSDNEISREYSAFIIANICANPDFCTIIGKNNGIPPLIMLAKSDSINTACLGIAALRRLANSDENWTLLIENGILDNLSILGLNNELEISREVSACLCSLSLSVIHRVEITYKCIIAIVFLTKSGDADVTRQATGEVSVCPFNVMRMCPCVCLFVRAFVRISACLFYYLYSYYHYHYYYHYYCRQLVYYSYLHYSHDYHNYSFYSIFILSLRCLGQFM